MRAWQVTIVAICVIAVIAILTRPLWMPRDPRDASELVRDAQSRFRSIPMRLVADLDESSLREHFAGTATKPEHMPDGSGSMDALLGEFTRFYTLRFITQDVEAYFAWRRGAGYQLRTYDDLNGIWQIEKDYEAIFRDTPPPDRDVARMFRKFFAIGLTADGGSAKPVRISNSAEGLAVVVGVMTSPSQTRPFVSGIMGAEIWQGKTSGTTRNWWNAPTAWRDVLKRDRRVVWAEVGIVTTFGDGAVHPRVHSFFWDPKRGTWVLDGVYDYNYARVGSALEY